MSSSRDEETPISPSPESFDFDDFFVDESDPGVEILPVLCGRVVPMRIKRGLSLDDREAAKARAIKQRLTPEGRMVADSIDEATLNAEVIARLVKSWPFERKGKPVPITPQSVRTLGADCVEEILREVANVLNAVEEATAPFAPPSDAA